MNTWYRFIIKHKFRTKKYKLRKFLLRNSYLFLAILFTSIVFTYLYNLQIRDIPYDRFVLVYEENEIQNTRKFYNGHIINKSRTKYILLWDQNSYTQFNSPTGRQKFIENKCKYQNCFVTGNRKYLADITDYDAIIFNVRHMKSFRHNNVPKKRSTKQIYIFYAMESAVYYPVCDEEFDGFFNWTVTYRLDSDIPVPYFQVTDKEGNLIAPKLDVKWKNVSGEITRLLANRLSSKFKAVAWFVSNCFAKSERNILANLLRDSLIKYDLDLDIYGKCGQLSCPISRQDDCDRMLKDDYFFYLAFENSFAVDYISEKVLMALDNDVLPIVLGGSNYSKFLPPGSYIDAMNYNDEQLATKLHELIRTPKYYWNYFKWKLQYEIHTANASNVCALCAALNNQSMYRNSVHEHLRTWWHPYYEDLCTTVSVNFSDYANENFKNNPDYNTQPGIVFI